LVFAKGKTRESLISVDAVYSSTDLPTPITCKSGGFEKQAQKNLEIRASNLETSKICVK